MFFVKNIWNICYFPFLAPVFISPAPLPRRFGPIVTC